MRAHPDFLLRGFVRRESCGRGLTGSWSEGRNEYYAYYHCRPGCRAVNVTKSKLKGLLGEIEAKEERVVDQNSASWNQLLPWLRQIDTLRSAQPLTG